MSKKTFKLSEPVTVEGDTFNSVTMKSYKGRSAAEFVARREEIAEGGNVGAQFILCSISSGAPVALFEEMEMADYADILMFMQPHFEKLMAAMGKLPKAKAENTPSADA